MHGLPQARLGSISTASWQLDRLAVPHFALKLAGRLLQCLLCTSYLYAPRDNLQQWRSSSKYNTFKVQLPSGPANRINCVLGLPRTARPQSSSVPSSLPTTTHSSTL